MRRRRLRRWARPSRTRLNPYTLMINSSRVLSLQNGEFGVSDRSVCEATDRSSTRLSKRTIYGFLHKSIRNAGNVRILSRFRNHPLRLNRTNAGATDVVVVPYRYKGTLEVAYVTGVSTLLGGGQNHALSVAIVSGSSSVKIRGFRQLKRLIAHELRSCLQVQNVTRNDFQHVKRCIGIQVSCKNEVDTLFTACKFISAIRSANAGRVDVDFVCFLEPSCFEISRFRSFLVGAYDSQHCFVYNVKNQDVLELQKPSSGNNANQALWKVITRDGPNYGTQHPLTNILACIIQSYHTIVRKQLTYCALGYSSRGIEHRFHQSARGRQGRSHEVCQCHV